MPKDDSVTSGRKPGRPRRSEPPRVSYDDVDRLLVFGEVVKCEDGQGTLVQYPSYRELARRFGVTHSLIAQYSRKYNCLRRREANRARIAVKADQQIVEIRAHAIAYSRDDGLRLIDTCLAGFEKALAEQRMRFDNPSDLNTLLRLKEYLMGGADSRQELHAELSLEALQERHARMLRSRQASEVFQRGESETKALPPGSVRELPPNSAAIVPVSQIANRAEDASGQLRSKGATDDGVPAHTPHVPACAPPEAGDGHEAKDDGKPPQGPDVADTAASENGSHEPDP